MVSAMPGRPGWWELRLHGENRPRVIAKVEERDGRGRVTRLMLSGDLDSSTMRAIPIGRIEAAVTHPKFGYSVAPTLPDDAKANLARRGEIFPEEFEQIENAWDRYLDGSADKLQAAMKVVRRKVDREPLVRPDGTDPDGFSRRVAAAYNSLVVTTATPAKVLAEEADVPVATVHRWIREARQRGHLPPARKGRAG